ncbi:MAG: peptidoglycan/LPS O-acetylase OafA/YrhL, partial [Planctomycetota bacterium]
MTDPIDFVSYQETRTFTALDGLRALAVLWVVAFHCEPSRWALQSIGLQSIELQWIGGH